MCWTNLFFLLVLKTLRKDEKGERETCFLGWLCRVGQEDYTKQKIFCHPFQNWTVSRSNSSSLEMEVRAVVICFRFQVHSQILEVKPIHWSFMPYCLFFNQIHVQLKTSQREQSIWEMEVKFGVQMEDVIYLIERMKILDSLTSTLKQISSHSFLSPPLPPLFLMLSLLISDASLKQLHPVFP